MCNLQSTFDVVMQSPDMKQGAGDWDIPPETELKILKQDIGKFVLVLDKSGSMDGSRFEQLKQSTMRWIKHDIDTGSLLGIVSFRYHYNLTNGEKCSCAFFHSYINQSEGY